MDIYVERIFHHLCLEAYVSSWVCICIGGCVCRYNCRISVCLDICMCVRVCVCIVVSEIVCILRAVGFALGLPCKVFVKSE